MSQPVSPVGTFPAAVDDSEYQLSVSDFDFLGISEAAAWACERQEAPLGIPEDLFPFMVESLFEALSRETLSDADVRLQGSSTSFFSNVTKRFPRSREARIELFVKEHGRLPSSMEIARMESKCEAVWGQAAPGQRPFDSMYVLGVSPDRSDIDVQISSDLAFTIASEIARARAIPPRTIRFDDPSYNFLIKAIADEEFLYLQRWSTHWQRELKRGVNIAIFDSNGPPRRDVGISSHHRESDWVLIHTTGGHD